MNSLSSVESALVMPHKYFAGYFSKKKKEKGKRKRRVSASFLSSRSGYKSFLFSGYEHVELSEKCSNGPRIIEYIIHSNDKWNNDSFSLETRSQLDEASSKNIYIYRIDTIMSNFSSPIISISYFARLELEISRISMEKLFAKVFDASKKILFFSD